MDRYAVEECGIERVDIAIFNDPHVFMCNSFPHPFYPYSRLDKAQNMGNVPLPVSTRGDRCPTQ